jgi:copper chaperone
MGVYATVLPHTPLEYCERASSMNSVTESTASVYTVTGMTCDHCARSVAEEVAEVEGVDHVDVDLASGRLEVTGTGFADETIAAAVEAAGYEVAA